jgi:hypothetical protein
MQLKTLVESKTALEGLLKSSLPINVAWELKKFIKIVNPELSSYEELRTQKIIEMGEEFTDDKGNKQSTVKPENMQEYTKIIIELLEKEVDVVIPQIKVKDLTGYKDVNGKGIDMTISDLIVLDWLIIEE